jgi:hypothetical protein
MEAKLPVSGCVSITFAYLVTEAVHQRHAPVEKENVTYSGSLVSTKECHKAINPPDKSGAPALRSFWRMVGFGTDSLEWQRRVQTGWSSIVLTHSSFGICIVELLKVSVFIILFPNKASGLILIPGPLGSLHGMWRILVDHCSINQYADS